MNRSKAPVVQPSYAAALFGELDQIEQEFLRILELSAINYVNPNRPGSVYFLGAADWGWAQSDDALESGRMRLLGAVRDWEPRLRMLFPHPTPTVQKRLDEGIDHLMRWLVRDDRYDHSIPKTIDEAAKSLQQAIVDLRTLNGLLPADEWAIRVVIDTNAFLDDPDPSIHRSTGRHSAASILSTFCPLYSASLTT